MTQKYEEESIQEPVEECVYCEECRYNMVKKAENEALKVLERIYGLPESTLDDENLTIHGIDPTEKSYVVKKMKNRMWCGGNCRGFL